MKNKKAIYLVNGITMLRIIGALTIPFVNLFLSPTGLVIYIICLLLTDALDGFLAKRLKACTVFGSLLDQAADKILGITILAVLAVDYPVMLLPLFTEILIVVVNMAAVRKGATGDSTILGKIKTLFLGITIIGGFSAIYAREIMGMITDHTPLGVMLNNIFYYLDTNITTVMTGVAFISLGTGLMVVCDYYLRARNDIKKAKEKGLNSKDIKLKTGKELMEALFCPEYYQKNKNQPLIKKIGCSKN